MSSAEAAFGVAIFGLGQIGRVHLKSLLAAPEAVSVRFVVEADTTTAEKYLQQLNLPSAGIQVIHIESAQSIFSDNSVKAVFICTPVGTHAALITKALNAGMAVFCEKPLTDDVDSARRLYQLAEDRGLPLHCGLQRCFDPQLRSLYELIREGSLGDIVSIKSCSRDPARMLSDGYFLSAGCIFTDMGVHDLDVVVKMAGEKPASVFAVGSARTDHYGKYDSAVINLTFPSGAVAIIDISRLSNYGYDQRVEVFGTGGVALSDNIRPTTTELTSAGVKRVSPTLNHFIDRYASAYGEEIAHFIRAVQGTEKLSVTADHVITIMGLVKACQRSAETGRVVQL